MSSGSVDLVRGRWRVRVSTPMGRKTVGFYDTQEEAEAVRDATVEALREAVPRLTVAEYGDRWLKMRALAGVVRDVENEISRWNNYVAGDRIAAMALANVKARDVEGLAFRIVAKGLSVPTAIAAVQVLRGMFHEAVRDGKARANPCLGARMPKDRRTEEAATILHPEQQSALLRALDDRHRPLVAFALGTGLRAGEVAALRREDVHADGPRPFVYVRFGGAPDAPPKNGKARTVALFGIGLEAAQIALATKGPNRHRLLFPAPRGGFRSKEHLLRWDVWCAAKKAIGVDLRWHDLRHTCATSLICGWWGRRWELSEVREQLGHADIQTTMRYTHIVPSALLDAAEGTGHGLVTPLALTAPKNEANVLYLKMAPAAGVEPATNALGKRCSIH